jgi:hypothetical protein
VEEMEEYRDNIIRKLTPYLSEGYEGTGNRLCFRYYNVWNSTPLFGIIAVQIFRKAIMQKTVKDSKGKYSKYNP